MGKHLDNIDDLFRTELGGGETNPPAFVKVNIDKALGFKNRKKGFFLFALIGLIVIGSGAILYNMNWNLNATEMSANSPNTENIKQESNQNQVNTNNSNSSNTNTFDPNSNQAHNNHSSDLGRDTVTNKISDNSSQNNLDDSKSSVNSSSNSGRLKLDKANNKDGSKNAIDKKTKEKNSSQAVDGGGITSQVLNQDKGNQLISEVDKNENEQQKSVLTAAKDSLKNVNESQLVEREIIDTNTAKDTTVSIKPQPDIKIPPPPKDDYKSWMISISGGPNFVRSNYTAVNMNDKTTYDNATEDQIGNQFNADILYGFKQGLSFGTGLGYSTFNERFNFQSYDYTVDTITNITYEYDTSGVVIDSSITYEYEEITLTYDNEGRSKASYVQIPIHLGAQLIFGKVQLDIFSSVRFNFLTSSYGAYMKDSQFVEFDKTTSIFKPFYVDLIFGSKVHYNFWKSLYLSGIVQYRPVIGNMYNTMSFNKSFDFVHLGLGLSVRF